MTEGTWWRATESKPPIDTWVFVVTGPVEDNVRMGDVEPNDAGIAYWTGEVWMTEHHEEAVEPVLWTRIPKVPKR